MAETFHEDMLIILNTELNRIKAAINEVMTLQRDGTKYTSSAKATAVSSIKTKIGSDAAEYAGNTKP